MALNNVEVQKHIHWLSTCEGNYLKHVLEEAKKLRKTDIAKVPEDVIENLADRFTEVCNKRYFAPVTVKGTLAFNVFYYPFEDEFQSMDSPVLLNTEWNIDWTFLESEQTKEGDVATNDLVFNHADVYLGSKDNFFNEQIVDHIPKAQEFLDVFNAACKEYRVDKFDMQQRLLKLKEVRDIDENNRH
jgi:hypothetical protein